MYKLINNSFTGELSVIQHVSDQSFIPLDPDNTDYQIYLEWLAEGNEPLPAD